MQRFSKFVRSPRVLILVAPFILMAPVWLAGKALYWGTPSTQFIPWWWQAWQTLRSGELPLWNPLVGMGAPLLANYQSALLYPPTWIYFALAAIGGLPLMAWGQAILVALHLAWAGWGMGLLIRRLGTSELAQTVGGLAFGLSGYLVARAHFLSINAAVAWLPWILLMAYELVYDPRNKRTMLKLALVLALQWLAGHAQIAWYTLILAIAWSAFWAWNITFARRSEATRKQSLRRLSRKEPLRPLSASALRFGLACLLAFCLSAAQLLPTAEYLANSQRASLVDFGQAATYSFWPWRLIGLVAPNFFGNPAHGDYWGYGNFWEDAIYIGLLPFLLACAALWWTRRNKEHKPLVIFLICVLTISFLLALGNNTPLFEWLYQYIPTFALFQSPTRFTIWLVFALSLLAGLAVDQWKRPMGRALYWSRLGAAAAIAVLIGAGIGWLLAGQGSLEAPSTFFSATLVLGIIALAAAWMHLRAPVKNTKPMLWAWLVGGLVTVDLLVAGWGLNPGTNLELYKEDTGLREDLREQLGGGRLFISESDEYELRYEHFFRFDSFHTFKPPVIRRSLLPDAFLLDGLPSANNYDPLLPARYKAWMDILNAASESNQKGLIARMGVTLVETVDANGFISFESMEALPRARWVECGESIETINQDFCTNTQEGSAEIIRESANSVVVAVDSPDRDWLVLADTFYPGWRAYARGNELTIYPADGLFPAVRLEPGQYELGLFYQPMWFYAGAALSLFSWLGFLLTWKRYNVQ